MAYTVTVVGSYPRPPREGGEFRLRKTLQALDRGEASPEDVDAAKDALVAEILAEQADAGVELATDGQVRWDDPLTRLADGLEGFSVSGLLRYFDNNTYFRQPVVKGPVGRSAPILVDEFRFAAEHSPVPVKAVLCGPYTLAALSHDEHYGDRQALVRDLAAALNAEARDLAGAGATVVQFDEPALAAVPGQPPGDLAALADVAERLVEGVEATTVLATYFGDVTAHGPAFFELPFGGFHLDFVSGPANAEAVHEFPGDRVLEAGVVDARNTKLEPAERLAAEIARLAEAVDPDRLWIAPSCGLEYLPRDAAVRKVRRLAEVKETLR
ncbi:MAG: methylcobamide--CoM methyltransferase [Actinomycetota bacterium]|nr:methylcobamide--CoM methyltransferase [Actinomycetota bacterium]